jgi:hypothetical protein
VAPCERSSHGSGRRPPRSRVRARTFARGFLARGQSGRLAGVVQQVATAALAVDAMPHVESRDPPSTRGTKFRPSCLAAPSSSLPSSCAAARPMLALLQPLPAVPGGLAPALPQGRAHTAERRHVPRRPRRRRAQHVLPAAARARPDAHPRPGPRRLPRPLDARGSPPNRPSAASPGTPSSTSRAPSRSASTRSRSPSPSSCPGSAVPSPSSAGSSARSLPTWNGRSRATWTSRPCGPTATAATRPGDRRLQGQEHPAPAGQRRPRPAGRSLPRRPLARRRPRARVLVRADRQARAPAQADEHQLRHHAPQRRTRRAAPASYALARAHTCAYRRLTRSS